MKAVKKILIGSEEICGLVAQLTNYYRSKGYTVVSIAGNNSFYSYTYDIDPYKFLDGWLKGPFESAINKLLFKIRYTLAPLKKKQALLNDLKIKFIQDFDLCINIWNCFLDEEIALKAVKEKKGKWITLMVGDDFRNRWIFKEHFNISNDLLKSSVTDKGEVMTKLKRLRLHEKYADVIFSVPDQSSLALRPYLHFQLPLDLSETKFDVPQNEKIKIIHCPSDTNSKGTHIIERVIQEIIDEKYNIEFFSLRKVPHTELMQKLTQADILVDELVFHGPGSLSLEAMASGCAVLTRYFEESPDCFKPPVISITADTLKTQLTSLLKDRAKIKELAVKGRKYVEENNNLAKIADSYLKSLENTEQFDYLPNYFRNEFNPTQFGLNVDEINALTQTVANCDWYTKWVKSGVISV